MTGDIATAPEENDMSATNDLIKQALALPPGERIELIEQVLNSLDQPDEAIDKLWAEEAERRLEDYRSGKMESVSMEDVMAKYSIK
jgi:putative addiction module component (TIGR02574 family)